MRLLEFGRDEGGANPVPAGQQTLASTTLPSPGETDATPVNTDNPKPKRVRSTRKARVFPIKAGSTRHQPIDLGQLQQRVELLEKRIKARTEALGDEVAARDLESLKQRMKLLERNVNSELWAARQREYAMLQLLAKPTLKMALRQRYQTFRKKTVPAVLAALHESWQHWWYNSQPQWWAGLASTWQEALDHARGITR